MKKLIALIGFVMMTLGVRAQDKILIDQVVAVVGSEIILQSDLENTIQQLNSQGMPNPGYCAILEQAIVQKMMLMQARFDSIPVSEDQVTQEMERRLDIFIRNAGGKENLENMLGKTLDEIRVKFYQTIEEQFLIQSMQQKITGSARVTPAEVRKYFNSIPKDSLPYISTEVQIGQITLKPPIQKAEKDKAIEQLKEIREAIIGGSSFSLKAKLYSDDLGSAGNGGELGALRREDLVEEFAAAAFSLEGDSISDVVETQFGFHIIQLIEKRGEYANFRHILIKPKVLTTDIYATIARLDSIYKEIKKGSIKFGDAALQFSQDENTKNNGGVLVNPINGSSYFSLDDLAEIDNVLFRAIEDLKVGDITEPEIFDEAGGKVIKILYIIKRIEAHVANLETDYAKIQQAALADKQGQLLNEWVNEKKDDFYIKISSDFKDCKFSIDWFNEKTQ